MALSVTTVSSPQELEKLSAEVHDWYFDVDAVRFAENDKTLVIQLEPSKRDLLNPRGRGVVLVISNIARVRVVDTEKVGLYDIYRIEHEPPVLRIVANMPLVFEVEVSQLQIKIEPPRRSDGSRQ